MGSIEMKLSHEELRARLARLSPAQRAALEHRLSLMNGRASAADQAVAAGPDQAAFPLSFSQQRLWFVEQLESDKAAYNICYAVGLKGDLEVAALRRAMAAVVRRHESLRTIFAEEDGQARQKILPPQPLPIPQIALSGLAEKQRVEVAKALLHRDSRRFFRLDRWPLIRMFLLCLGPGDHVLGLVQHHIVSDGWSLNLLIRDLVMFYGEQLGRLPAPPPLPIQYKDFALWQRSLGDELEQQRRYWRSTLAGVPSFLDVPTDRPRPETQVFSGARYPFVFSAEAVRGLRSLAAEYQGVTQFMALLMVFQCLLGHLSRQEAFAVSTPLSYRNRKEFEPVVGFFVNTLLFRADLSGDPELAELLARVRSIVLEACSHQDLPLEAVIQEVVPGRVLSYSPFLQVSLNFIQGDLGGVGTAGDLATAFGRAAGIGDLRIEDFEFEDATNALVELGLVVSYNGEQLRGSMHYKRDLFETATIALWVEQYQAALVEVGRRPRMRYSELRQLLAGIEHERRTREQERLRLAARPQHGRGRRSAVVLTDPGEALG